jgi:hypothetical protein
MGRASAKSNLKDYEGAIADCTKALEIDSSSAPTYYLIGVSKIYPEQKDSGCQDLNKAGKLGLEKSKEAIRKFCH